jgi:hypothetical protein
MAMLHGAAPRHWSGTAGAGFARRTSPCICVPRLVPHAPRAGTLFSEGVSDSASRAVMQHIVFCLSSEPHRSKKTLQRSRTVDAGHSMHSPSLRYCTCECHSYCHGCKAHCNNGIHYVSG